MGTGEAIGAQYLEGANGNGDYERVEETINNEVSRIRKEITESPYKVRDLGIQVMVEPPTPDDLNSLPQERVEDITKILGTIVRTTIDKESLDAELTDEVIEDKVVVSVQPFNGKVTFENQVVEKLPWWVYLIGGLLLAGIVVLLLLFMRSRKREVEEYVMEEKYEQIRVPDVNKEFETEGTMKKKQLEKMAKEKPEDFAKLLRTWISED
ncbi:flagellar M-ring protein FliF C-terminal domain-containing protein [Mesobacillus boroniphilus]|uniref:Flagellar M-ring protein FliF n=1 Tax=Mesobacillus boroniphilus JCM 21738 TaxID=1294265 RepID=W4RH70_9BACI|nr:flagellar M-ring protein FliF C-terminal domain-containing protein [Mesobacillus boroniphilus]GAE43646.1 flagellar M-ring protein FliF [Mesobacillus boroniphilus JCM 21738]